jgi:hypothetical protein
MYRKYVSPRGRTHAIERRIQRRDVRYGGLIGEIHAVVSVPPIKSQTQGCQKQSRRVRTV